MKEIISSQGYQRDFVASIPPDDDGTPIQGACDQENRIINISKRDMCCRKTLTEVAIHEDIHAVFPEFDERETWHWTEISVRELKPAQKEKIINLYDHRTTRHIK